MLTDCILRVFEKILPSFLYQKNLLLSVKQLIPLTLSNVTLTQVYLLPMTPHSLRIFW